MQLQIYISSYLFTITIKSLIVSVECWWCRYGWNLYLILFFSKKVKISLFFIFWWRHQIFVDFRHFFCICYVRTNCCLWYYTKMWTFVALYCLKMKRKTRKAVKYAWKCYFPSFGYHGNQFELLKKFRFSKICFLVLIAK